MKARRSQPTPQQKRAIELFKVNVLKGGTKTVEQILLDAGYAPASARQQMNVMEGLRPHLNETIAWMEKHRTAVQQHMEKQIEFAEYKDLVKALDVLTYNLQLLGGKPTANIAISADVRTRIEQLIED